MFMEAPQTLIFATVGAFLLGWIVAKIGSWLASRGSAKSRDPRDNRIRSLEAEHRVVKNDLVKSSNEIEQLKKDLADEQTTVAEKNQALIAQNEKFVALRRDLKDSVKKTRELRTELTDRVTENLKAEVKLREVETELSVAQASTDMIATGVLDYSMTPEGKEDEDEKVQAAKAGP